MFIELESKPVYVYTGGKTWSVNTLQTKQPTLVFIHGAQHDHSVWALQSRYFANHGYPVIAVDLPGHGRSSGPALASVQAMANWLGKVLGRLEVQNAVLIGHSMGSLIALELAASAASSGGGAPVDGLVTNRLETEGLTTEGLETEGLETEGLTIKGLALLGTAIPMRVSDALLGLTQTSEADALDQINAWSHSTIAQRPGSPGPGFSTYIQNLRLMQRQQPRLLHNDFSACNNYLVGAHSAAQVSCPTIVIQGELDVMTPAKSARESLKLFRNPPSFVTIDQAGHAVMAERPDSVLNALRNWMKDLSL